MFNPRIEKMTTRIKVQNRHNGAWVDASPPSCFCNWKGRDDAASLTGAESPAWETSQLALWFRPDIDIGSRIIRDGKPYSVSHIENIELRNKYLIAKVRRLSDARAFKLFRPTVETDAAGDHYNTYPETTAEFEASIQPHREENASEPYGVDLRYDFVLYTTDEADLRELDRFGESSPEYEIKIIQEWPQYKKIIARRVQA